LPKPEDNVRLDRSNNYRRTEINVPINLPKRYCLVDGEIVNMLCDILHTHQQYLSGIEMWSFGTCNGREKKYTHILSSLFSHVQLSCLFMKEGQYSHVRWVFSHTRSPELL